MAFGFGKSKADKGPQEDEPRDSRKRRTLRGLVGLAGAAIATGSLAPENANMQGRYAERHRASRELARDGITAELKRRRIPVSEALADGFSPFGYTSGGQDSYTGEAGSEFMEVIRGATVGALRKDNEKRLRELEESFRSHPDENAWILNEFKASWDAWRLYLGLPQQFKKSGLYTFGVSDFRPDDSAEDKYYLKFNNFEDVISRHFGLPQESEPGSIPFVKRLLNVIEHTLPDPMINPIDPSNTLRDNPVRAFATNMTLGRFVVSKGADRQGAYVSYWDVWDLNKSIAGDILDADFKMEFYDRIYYDSATFKPLNPQPRS